MTKIPTTHSYHRRAKYGISISRVARECVSTHTSTQVTTSGHYDSLMAKLIVHDEARQAAMQRMLRALEEFRVQGVQTTIPLHVDILKNEAFRKGDYTTRFMQEHFSGVLNPARN